MHWILVSTGSLLGVVSLRAAWGYGRTPQPVPAVRSSLRATGWLLLAASALGWMHVAGSDRGLAIAGLGLCLAGMICLLEAARHEPARKVRTRPGPRTPQRARPERHHALRLWARGLWVVMLAGPIAIIAALTLAMLFYALSLNASLPPATGLSIGLIAVPLLWCALLPVATSGLRLRTRTAVVVALAIFGGAAYPVLPKWIA